MLRLGLDPAAQLHGFHNPVDCDHIGCIAHADFLFNGHVQDTLKRLGHVRIQFLQDFFFSPVEVHIILDTLKVGNRNATGVAQEIRDYENIALL